jgi:hypothetical protein
MVLFISYNNFWRVRKLYGFGKKLLGTLGDTLKRYYSLHKKIYISLPEESNNFKSNQIYTKTINIYGT